MRAEDLSLKELVAFEDGLVSLKGRRLVLHDLHAFAQFRNDVLQMVGVEQGRRMLTRFGWFWGEADAAAMRRVFHWNSPIELIKAGPRMHTLQGVVRSSIKMLDVDPGERRLTMRVVWRGSGEAQEHVAELGPSEYPVCWMLVGYMSGYVSSCLGSNVYFLEDKCRATGQAVCSAIGKDVTSWGDELESWVGYFESDDIQEKVTRLTEALRRRTRELVTYRRRLVAQQSEATGGLVAVRSASFQRVLEAAGRVAAFDASVLVTGESGVGKEVLAKAIHHQSARSKAPFVAVNCAALPETLLSSELFGHARGAFTGAVGDRAGLFEEAHGGTIFLDEIGEISPAMQVLLLRVLQSGEITRVGENKPRHVNARVVAATNRNLRREVVAGTFREDLLYRLAVVEIEIPPLRDRLEDIVPLARYFVDRLAKKMKIPALRLDASCLDYLQAYRWPGNVRELENAIERAAVFCEQGLVLPEHLPQTVLAAAPEVPSLADPLKCTLAQLETEHIRRVLAATHNNRTRAAKILGISPTTLWRKLKSDQ